jgi:hypothetical protein
MENAAKAFTQQQTQRETDTPSLSPPVFTDVVPSAAAPSSSPPPSLNPTSYPLIRTNVVDQVIQENDMPPEHPSSSSSSSSSSNEPSIGQQLSGVISGQDARSAASKKRSSKALDDAPSSTLASIPDATVAVGTGSATLPPPSKGSVKTPGKTWSIVHLGLIIVIIVIITFCHRSSTTIETIEEGV